MPWRERIGQWLRVALQPETPFVARVLVIQLESASPFFPRVLRPMRRLVAVPRLMAAAQLNAGLRSTVEFPLGLHVEPMGQRLVIGLQLHSRQPQDQPAERSSPNLRFGSRESACITRPARQRSIYGLVLAATAHSFPPARPRSGAGR